MPALPNLTGRHTTFPVDIGDYGDVECEVAREALSARIDGEREPVPSSRVDEHVASCRLCAQWYTGAQQQADALRRLATAGVTASAHATPAPAPAQAGWRPGSLRAALAVAGLLQIGFAVAQAAGANFGMVAAHDGTATGAHLLNESTAWSAAVGLVTVAAAFARRLLPGLACVLLTFTVVLGYYVVTDVVSGQVTIARVVSHLPVVFATVLALLAWWTSRPGDPAHARAATESAFTRPGAARDRKRDLLRPTDDSAA